jgi:hypothetical protein
MLNETDVCQRKTFITIGCCEFNVQQWYLKFQLATVTNFIQPETVQKVLVSVNVKSRMPHQTAIDVVTGIMDIRIVSLVTVSWMGLEEDNVKIMVDNVPANRILAENYVMNALMVSTTSQSANVKKKYFH